MGDLIFILPIFIISFFILLQIFSFFKRGFDSIRKNFNLTIDQAGEKIENTKNKQTDYNQEEVKKRIAEAEKESLAESKERILNQNSETEAEKKESEKKAKENLNRSKSYQGNKNKNSLGEIFNQYNEIEKTIIYNEILSKPKALRKD